MDNTKIKSGRLEDILNNERVVILIHGPAASPITKASKYSINALKQVGVEFLSIDIDKDVYIKKESFLYSGWKYFPQLYVDGDFIGGSIVIKEFLFSGEMERILSNKRQNKTLIKFSTFENTSIPQKYKQRYKFRERWINGHEGAIWDLIFLEDYNLLVTFKSVYIMAN